MTLKLLILAGGQSEEHAVSLISAKCVLAALGDVPHLQPSLRVITRAGTLLDAHTSAQAVASGVPAQSGGDSLAALIDAARTHDVVWPLLHGPLGEDGTIQGLLQLVGVPYVGCGVLAASLCMDKPMAKEVLRAAGLPQVPYTLVTQETWHSQPDQVVTQVSAQCAAPWFVKPANMGSSVGIGRADDEATLRRAIDVAFQYDRRVIIEEGLAPVRELEVACLGNAIAKASVAGEICHDGAFYDYATKYTPGHSSMVIPAHIPKDVADEACRLALATYALLDCRGLARIDFFYSEAKKALYINEVNTMPGFTQFSMYPALWQHAGLSYGQLIEELVGLAQDNFRAKP